MEFTKIISQLTEAFGTMSRRQKLVMGGVFAGLFILLFLVSFFAGPSSRDNYQVLFDSLAPRDSARVIEQLKKDRVPYRIVNENVIEVPREKLYEERIVLASLGIPKENKVGFERFDEQAFGATTFDKNVKFLRTLEGELVRRINALGPVHGSSVHLALPKEVAPTASVMVELKPFQRLSAKQTEGIKNLVASAVVGLRPENVTLINANGETLGDRGDSSSFKELSATQQQFKEREEHMKEEKVVNVLSPFLGGSEHVVAKVTIEFDFSQKHSTSEVYDPNRVVRSEQHSEALHNGSASGVPGIKGDTGVSSGTDTPAQQLQKSRTTNYEISKTLTTTQENHARIRRITAAVVIDKNTAPDEEERWLAEITTLVKQSIGINEKRGDRVSVRHFRFTKPKAEAALPAIEPEKERSGLIALAEPYAPLFMFLLVVLIAWVVLKAAVISLLKPGGKTPSEAGGESKPSEAFSAAAQAKTERAAPKEDASDMKSLLTKVRAAAAHSPEEVAILLQALMEEERSSGKEKRIKTLRRVG